MKTAQQKNYTVDTHGFSHDGRGITTIDGIITFIDGALPNEKLVCQITKKHRNYQEAKIIELLTPTEKRITPECAHFGVCGGCSMQHLNIEHQIQFKQATLLEQLARIGKVTPEQILPPLIGSPWGYRRKARLGVRYVTKKGKLFVGFREKMSSLLTPINKCLVLNPAVGNHFPELTTLIESLTQFEKISQIEVTIGDLGPQQFGDDVSLVFRHMADLPTSDLDKLREFGEKNKFRIYLQPNPPASITKLMPNDNLELLSYFLPDYQLEMQFHPLDFIQVNGDMNRKLIPLALQLLDPQPTDTILDLFCGLGNFTLPIARSAKQVVGIEGSKEMVLRAQQNAAKNAIHNTEFYAANLMEPNSSAPWLKKSYEKILLDPPRTGAKEILPYLADLSAKKIVYISCNPATLARDADELIRTAGYKLKVTGMIDMFPHTNHIEAIAVFEK